MIQKWDYATVGLLNSYGLQYKLNGEKQNHWKDKPLHEVLHDLGDQGWELISYDGEAYIFKRPVAATGGIKTLGHTSDATHQPGHAADPQHHGVHPVDPHAHAGEAHPPSPRPVEGRPHS
jgi:hypothetical protein